MQRKVEAICDQMSGMDQREFHTMGVLFCANGLDMGVILRPMSWIQAWILEPICEHEIEFLKILKNLLLKAVKIAETKVKAHEWPSNHPPLMEN